jgi:tetratricopeptide (TPR) repeat protein
MFTVATPQFLLYYSHYSKNCTHNRQKRVLVKQLERILNRSNLMRNILPFLMILLLGILSYSNSFDVPLQFDDYTALRKTIDGSLRIGFSGGVRWFTDLTFSLNRLAHGELVVGYHIVNLTIHLAAALCIFLCIRATIEAMLSFQANIEEDRRNIFLLSYVPFATAALFVCHPVQTQAVTYIAQRYTSLATFFYLAAMYSYLRARQSAIAEMAFSPWYWGGASLSLALLAMMSKEIAFTLPLMFAVLEALFFRGRLLKKPLFIVLGLGLMLIVPLQLLNPYGVNGVHGLMNGLQHVTSETQSISRSDYLLTQLRVVATYLRLMVLPINQNLDYDYPIYHSIASLPVLASLALHLVLAIMALTLFKLSKGRFAAGNNLEGTAMRLGTFGICWFYLTLMVESSIIPIQDVINEHRLYLPSGGILLLATSIAGGYATVRPAARAALWWVTAFCCLALTTGSLARNRVWSDELLMWQDVLAKSPNKARAQFNFGLYLAKRSQPAKALPHLVRALELDPAPQNYWITFNSAIPELGTFSGRCSNGMQYQSVIESVNPEFLILWRAVCHNNLGLAYEYLGNLQSSRSNIELATTINPSLDLAWLNLAIISAKQHDRPAFENALARLRDLNPPLASRISSIRFDF